MRHTIICPHCRVTKSMCSYGGYAVAPDHGHLLLICENCDCPTTVFVKANHPDPKYRRFGDFQRDGETVEGSGWRVLDSWPKLQYEERSLPDGVPESIRQHFQHSQEAATNGGYDLSIQGFQRVLSLTKSQHSPEFRGTLNAWILWLIKNGRLLAGVKHWLNRIPLQSEKIGATALQAEEFATFVFSVLDQLFGVNSQIRRYRAGGAVA